MPDLGRFLEKEYDAGNGRVVINRSDRAGRRMLSRIDPCLRAAALLTPLLGIGSAMVAQSITEFTVGGQPRGIAAGPDGNLWFADETGNIGRITTQGGLTEFPVSGSQTRPYFIAAGPDGAMWFTETTGNRIGRITMAGAITEFAVPTASSRPTGIVSGPDGALWFTQPSISNLGRMSIYGAATQIGLPANTANPVGITAGPDGNIWFTEYNAGKIARIVP